MNLQTERKVWLWLVQSSADPQKASLTIKGILVGVLPFLMQYLPLLGVHLTPSLSGLPDEIYGVVFYGLTTIASVMAVLGFVRKLYFSIKN